jgi:tetratricopeptide (TPR) repeat protein
MTCALPCCLVILAAAAVVAPPSPATPPPPPVPVVTASAPTAPTAAITVPMDTIVDPLIKNLGAQRFQVREDATESLRRIGLPAYESLQKAAVSKDPEVSVRASRIVDDLSLGITPDWPAEMAVMARRCDEMNDSERDQAISRITQTVGARSVLFLVQRLISSDVRGSQRAMYALQSFNSDEVARLVLSAVPNPQGPNQLRTVTWAVSRVGLPYDAVRFKPKPETKPADPKEDPAGAGVKSVLALVKQKKFEEARQAAVELAKTAPGDARPVYLEAEALVGLGKDADAKAARTRAVALNPDNKPPHAAAALMLERLGRRGLAATEWETLLKIAPAGGVPDMNAQIRLSQLYDDSGLFEQAVKYLQAALDLYEKSKETVTLEGANADTLRQELARLAQKSQRYSPVSGAGLEDNIVNGETTVEVFAVTKDDKLEEWRKTAADVAATISVEIQPRDLRIFVDVPATLRYDPKDHTITALLGDVPCAKPIVLDLGNEKTDVRLGVDTPGAWLLFIVNTVTGEVKESARFEKNYVLRIKAPLVLAGLTDSAWSIQGRRCTGEDVPKGVLLETLPNEIDVVVEGTTADKRRLTWTLKLSVGKAQMAPAGFEVPQAVKTGTSVTVPGGGIINIRGGRLIIGGGGIGQPVQIFDGGF